MSKQSDLQISIRPVNERTMIMDFRGELDIVSTVKARELMSTLIGEGCRELVVNLQYTDYIDSSGLGLLMSTLRRFREKGGGVRLTGLSARIRRLFEVTRLALAFPIDASEEEALAIIADSHIPQAA